MSDPKGVTEARERAVRIGFELSCDDGTGRLLAVLAAAVPEGARILEIGTGVGMGCAWMVHGLGSRTDVELVSIEFDAAAAAAAAEGSWPAYVRLIAGDVNELLPTLGMFDLIFPDAPAGKWTGLGRTIASLRPRGVLVVDDLTAKPDQPEEWNEYLARTRDKLLSHPDLVAVEIADLTGVIIATKIDVGP
jgi:demethylmenaquinone methyltransferase/2-methoxy-6-polyprenyl-1,4-benzoquinol methylase